MSSIQQALGKLFQSIETLDAASLDCEQKILKGNQQDMFNSTAEGVVNGNGHLAIDPSILAQKLDVTIERVEQILREG